ncbi:MAG: ATP-dependent RNA helicase HrpA [Phycisphaerales bacterium]
MGREVEMSDLWERARCVDVPRLAGMVLRGDTEGAGRELAESERLVRARGAGLPRPALDADLPICGRWEEIAAAVVANPVVVVCGETGSGKTTQLPQICLRAGRGARGMIGHTQPRRIAARSVAARIGEELGVGLGGVVGVKVRFSDRTSERTAIKLMTDGMLLAETAGDRELLAYDTIIIDEAHERSLNVDFLLGYLRRLAAKRPDLRVIVTSATIDPGRFAAFFEEGLREAGVAGAVVPVVNVSGRTYPVRVRYAEKKGESPEEVRPGAVADAVEEVIGGGDVLVFLPGEKEIRQCEVEVRRRGLEVLPLYARLTNEEQDRVFRWRPGGPRRVVLATNVAETSLTVPGIRAVVDTGLARISRYDPLAKVQRLPVELVSRASADQRAGRCGRLGPGECVRLWSEEAAAKQDAFTEPEIRRSNLASVILQMHALELGEVERFPFLDPPEARAITDGLATLFELGAIDRPGGEGRITELGRRLARLPLEPRVGRMLLAAEEEGCVDEVLVLAAGLSVQDPRERPGARAEAADAAHKVFEHPTSDFLTLLNLWEQYTHEEERLGDGALRGWCRDHFVSAVRMREWSQTWWQLREMAEEMELRGGSRGGPPDEDRVHRALLTGLIANVCCKDEALGAREYRGFRGNVVSLFPGSVLFKKSPRWVMAAEVVETSRLYARTLARIEPAWVEELAGHVMQRQLSDKHYDAERAEACVWERVSMNGVVVVPRRKASLSPLDAKGARALFLTEGLAGGRYGGVEAFSVWTRAVLARAQGAEARLRKRGLVRHAAEIAEWFEARVPGRVVDGATFAEWWSGATAGERERVMLRDADVMKPGAVWDEAAYPNSVMMGGASVGVTYRFEPGKDEDGVTFRVALEDAGPAIAERAEWLVPGMLEEKVAALVKGLAKQHRSRLPGADAGLAAELSGVMAFGEGPLPHCLSEAVEVLHGVRVPTEAWPVKGLAAHLKARMEVVDKAGREIACGRDATEAMSRVGPRAAKARAARERERFERSGVREWDFGALPERVETEGGVAFPAVVDLGDAAGLTLASDERVAAAVTLHGVRRLLAISCGEEVQHRLVSMAGWDEMVKWHGGLGDAKKLAEDLTLVVCERCFLSGQSVPRTGEEFEARREGCWGRLAQATMEAAAVAAGLLEPRHRVAGRLASGTSRHWAASVADLREQGAYLMPRGFLAALPWERLREYPRYVGAMRDRLLGLREDGSGGDGPLMQRVQPHWKNFTGWVAREMARQRDEAARAGEEAKGAKGGKAPLPGARRAAPSVNVEAGEWAMAPGSLSRGVEAFRWAIEEYRVALFAPARGGATTEKDLERLWAVVK